MLCKVSVLGNVSLLSPSFHSDSKPLTTESTEEHRQAADKLAAEEADDDTDGKKEDVIVDTEMFGGHAYRPLERRDLRPFTVATVFAVFFSSVFAIGSLVCRKLFKHTRLSTPISGSCRGRGLQLLWRSFLPAPPPPTPNPKKFAWEPPVSS